MSFNCWVWVSNWRHLGFLGSIPRLGDKVLGQWWLKLHSRVRDLNSWHLGGNGPNFFVSWPISKCFTSKWGASRKARQWAPSHPSIIQKRTFFVRFLPPTLTPCPRIKLMTLWIHRFDPRAWQLSSWPLMSKTWLPCKTIKNRHMYVIEGWDGVHNIAFFVAPQIMVRNFDIWPTVKKLGLIEFSKAVQLEMTVIRSKTGMS